MYTITIQFDSKQFRISNSEPSTMAIPFRPTKIRVLHGSELIGVNNAGNDLFLADLGNDRILVIDLKLLPYVTTKIASSVIPSEVLA